MNHRSVDAQTHLTSAYTHRGAVVRYHATISCCLSSRRDAAARKLGERYSFDKTKTILSLSFMWCWCARCGGDLACGSIDVTEFAFNSNCGCFTCFACLFAILQLVLFLLLLLMLLLKIWMTVMLMTMMAVMIIRTINKLVTTLAIITSYAFYSILLHRCKTSRAADVR